ncbi:(2Fe-2S) ferredoxin domain-containing protein [bacterium]|nr:(2Fe-2S) ferredoxin domain-containing protein [bacterium]
MIDVGIKVRKLVLVCTNERTDGTECCAMKGSVELHKKLKEAVKAVTHDVRVSKTGCLDRCSAGATVVIMPDNVWLGQVTEEDIPEIVKLIV